MPFSNHLPSSNQSLKSSNLLLFIKKHAGNFTYQTFRKALVQTISQNPFLTLGVYSMKVIRTSFYYHSTGFNQPLSVSSHTIRVGYDATTFLSQNVRTITTYPHNSSLGHAHQKVINAIFHSFSVYCNTLYYNSVNECCNLYFISTLTLFQLVVEQLRQFPQCVKLHTGLFKSRFHIPASNAKFWKLVTFMYQTSDNSRSTQVHAL